jgi:hypothetical protein
VKIDVIKKVDRADLAARGEIPPWVDPLIDAINQFIDPVGRALAQRLDFENNFLCRKIEAEFTTDVESIFNPTVKAPIVNPKAIGMIPIHTGGVTLTGQKFTQKDDGTIGITLTFTGATTADFRIILFLG